MWFFLQFSMRPSLDDFVFLQLPSLIITMQYFPCHLRGLSLSSEYRFGCLKCTIRLYLIIGSEWIIYESSVISKDSINSFFNSWYINFSCSLWKIEKFLSSFLTNWTLEQKYSKCLYTKAFYLYIEFHLLTTIKTVPLIPQSCQWC